jgi:aspartate aminotransferase
MMKTTISTKLAEVGRAATIEFGEKAGRMKSAGVDVVDLAIGIPDFDTPQHIVDATIEALRAGFTRFVPSRGIPELRQALATKFKQDNNLEVNPDTDIIGDDSGEFWGR